MVWFYERDGEVLEFETRVDNDTSEFVLLTRTTDGNTRSERFADATAFQSRISELTRQLEQDRWSPQGTTVLPDGWRLT
jgi:hypothetical protein